jgi:EpsI family protein
MTEDSIRARSHPPLSWPHVLIGVAMIVASGLAIALTPSRHLVPEGAVDLQAMIPHDFGTWRELKTGIIQMDLSPREGEERTMQQPYDQTLMRTYVRNDGAVVMLALAYGRTQRQEVKIHRPELCYVSQGFMVKRKSSEMVEISQGASVPVHRLLTGSQARLEPVTYWIRIGDRLVSSAWESRAAIFLEGLQGKIPDGILVRVSTPVSAGADVPATYAVQDAFLKDLLNVLSGSAKTALLGHGVRP